MQDAKYLWIRLIDWRGLESAELAFAWGGGGGGDCCFCFHATSSARW